MLEHEVPSVSVAAYFLASEMTGSSLEIDVDVLLVMSLGLQADLFQLERERPVFCPVFTIVTERRSRRRQKKKGRRLGPHASPLS